MEKIQIILEAVAGAQAKLTEAIKQVDDLTAANVRNANSVDLVKRAIIQELAAEEARIQKLYALKAATYDIAQAEKMRLADGESGTRVVIGHAAAIGGLTSSLGKNRVAYLELGHVARSTIDSLAAGISPTRTLAMELPRIIQAGAFLGVGLSTVAMGMAALIPLIISGAEAWSAYHAKVQEAASVVSVYEQRQALVTRNEAMLDEARKKGLVTLEEYFKIQKLLNIAAEDGNETALISAVREMNKLGIATKQIEAYEKLVKLRREMVEESMITFDKEGNPENFDQQRAKAADQYKDNIKQITELAKVSKMAKAELDAALDENSKAYGTRLSEIQSQESKKRAAEKLKSVEQDITLNEMQQTGVRIGQADKEFKFRTDNYKQLAQLGIITEDERTNLTIEAEKKRLAEIKKEDEEITRSNAKQRQFQEDKIKGIEDENRGLEEQLRAQLDIIESEKRRQDIRTHPSGVRNGGLDVANSLSSIFDKTLSKKKNVLSEHLSGLQTEGEGLHGALEDMQTAPPGMFKPEDMVKVQQQIEENKRKQIQAAQDIKDAEVAINQQRLAGVSGMLGGMATIAKSFGKEGFAAYKAFAIAQATIDTARAAIAAYQSTVGIPYVGPILAPIAAGVAVAAGAAQIANIEAQSYAKGGMIHGPGTGTSDDVPIYASDREFMVRNAIVEQPGAEDFLRDFNARGMDAISFHGSPVAGTRTTSSFAGGSRGNSNAVGKNGSNRTSIGFVNTRNELRKFMRQEGTKVVIDGLAEHGNEVAA